MHINVNLSLFFIYAYVHLIIRKKNMHPGTAPGNGEMDLDFHVAFSISLHLLYWVTVHLSFSLSIMCHEWLLNLCIWMFAKIGAEDIPVPYCSFPPCDWLLDEMGSCKPAPWSRWGDCRCRTFWIEVCSDDIGDWFFQGVRISCKKGRRSHNPRRLRCCSSVGVGICHT